MENRERKCGACRWGVFNIDEATGGQKWSGLCAMHQSKKSILLRVEQHFHCSNGKFEAKKG